LKSFNFKVSLKFKFPKAVKIWVCKML
jgi:hypothetical protein